MNWAHLRTFVWLRWRLMVNQLRRAGFANALLLGIITVGAVLLAIPLVFGSIFAGMYAGSNAQPTQLLYLWDGLVVAFLFFWLIGLLTELQRSEPVSLSKFLHLPVSVSGVFLLNYLSSLVRLSLVFFVPVMVGFGVGLLVSKGWPMLLLLPSVAALVLMVSAVTYQFQGWLGAIMTNPRRRRTVGVAATVIIILLVQIPNLLNMFGLWHTPRRLDPNAGLTEALKKLDEAGQEQGLGAQERARLQRELVAAREREAHQVERQETEQIERSVRLANMVLPVGWLPLGVMSAAEGNVVPSALGLVGMSLIGTASLYRAYRKTIELYRGESSRRRAAPTKLAAAPPAKERTPRTLLLEARLPACSEPVSVIALAALRSLVRSPEGKMMLLSPLFSIAIFSGLVWRARERTPEPFRPWIAVAGLALALLAVLQVMANQFGFDRDGFRVFVLSAARRRDILAGKNLAFAPLAFAIAAAMAVITQVICPMRIDHFVALLPQFASMFLLFCILANLLSIFTPTYIAPGALKASNPKLSTVLVQLATIMIVFPLTQAITLLPLAAELALRLLGWSPNLPIFLVLALAECAVIALIYFASLGWLGNVLQEREQKILETVIARAT